MNDYPVTVAHAHHGKLTPLTWYTPDKRTFTVRSITCVQGVYRLHLVEPFDIAKDIYFVTVVGSITLHYTPVNGESIGSLNKQIGSLDYFDPEFEPKLINYTIRKLAVVGRSLICQK